jgi:hypothetical protein
MSFQGISRSIIRFRRHCSGDKPLSGFAPETHRLMSLRPVIPQRVALLHCPPPLCQPMSILNRLVHTVNHHLARAGEFSTGTLGNFQPVLTASPSLDRTGACVTTRGRTGCRTSESPENGKPADCTPTHGGLVAHFISTYRRAPSHLASSALAALTLRTSNSQCALGTGADLSETASARRSPSGRKATGNPGAPSGEWSGQSVDWVRARLESQHL